MTHLVHPPPEPPLPRGARAVAKGALLARERRIGAFLRYRRHVAPDILLTRDGWVMAVLALDGFAAECADRDEIRARQDVFDLALRGLGSSEWGLYAHVLRRPAMVGARPASGVAFADAFEAAYTHKLRAHGLYQNAHFLTLIRRPLQGRAGLLDEIGRTLTRRSAATPESLAATMASLREGLKTLVATLDRYGPRLLTTEDRDGVLWSHPLGFLSALLNGGAPSPLALPDGPLSEALARRRLIFRRETAESRGPTQADTRYIAMLSVRDYPTRTAAGMLDALMRAPITATLSQSFAIADRAASIARIRGVQGRMHGADDAALSLAQGLNEAADHAASGRAVFGHHHLTLAVEAESPAALDGAVAEAVGALAGAGIVAVREDIGLEAAFWAQMPANFDCVARRALISSANFTGLAAPHRAPSGRARSVWGAPLLMLETPDGGPFRFHLHVGDVGNATVIGPTGSGKTVFLNALMTAAAFVPGARVILFDKDRGAELAVRALGGQYRRIAPDGDGALNPLALADSPATRAFLGSWLMRLAAPEVGAASARDLAILRDCVDANFAAPIARRRLRDLAALFSGHEPSGPSSLAARLSPWFGAGAKAWLFDHDAPVDLAPAPRPMRDPPGGRALDVHGFDLTAILTDPSARTAALMALFHAIAEGLDGRPTLLILDEAWRLLDDPVFAQQIKDWEKTIRKKNGAVLFATQSADDALTSSIATAIIEQSPTQIFFPNLKADDAAYGGGFGLTPAEVEIVRTLPETGRAFLLKQGAQSLVVRFDLGGLNRALTILSGRAQTMTLFDRVRRDLRDADVGGGDVGGADRGAADPSAADDPHIWLPALFAALEGASS